jgi:hypothetical protein
MRPFLPSLLQRFLFKPQKSAHQLIDCHFQGAPLKTAHPPVSEHDTGQDKNHRKAYDLIAGGRIVLVDDPLDVSAAD